MSDNVRLALAEIIERLQNITVAGGFNTNAGGQVYLGRRGFDAATDTFPVISVFAGAETTERLTHSRYRCLREIRIECYVSDIFAPTAALELLIEDVQRALELADETLGANVNAIEYNGIDDPEPRDDGGTLSALVLRYMIEYDRDYGA